MPDNQMTQCHQKICGYPQQTLKADYELIRANHPDHQMPAYDDLSDTQKQFHAESYADYKSGLEKIAKALREGLPLNTQEIFNTIIKDQDHE